jgi:hypothetical protein
MGEIPSINLFFDDPENSIYLLKFGKKENLESFKSGNVRFNHISYYREYEDKKNNNIIGDNKEGVESIFHLSESTRIIFSHPLINNATEIDITNSIKDPILTFPDSNDYILCLSYFTANDVKNSTVYDDKCLEEAEWDSVMLITDTRGFIKNIMTILKEYTPHIRPVKYYNTEKKQMALSPFDKSSKYSWQKEFRMQIDLTNSETKNINRINKKTVEFKLPAIQSVILPINEFREGFYL